VKKLVVMAVLVGVGYVGYQKWSRQREENDVWSQATDPVAPRDLR
jgi:predicted negative regulator of RcsB-dependent stress response